MTALTEQIAQRCTEARKVINTAWSVRDLAVASLLVTQVEVLALMAAGTVQLPDKVPEQESATDSA